MTMYNERTLDRRPALLERATKLQNQTILPREALVHRLQAPPVGSRAYRKYNSLRRRWLAMQLPDAGDPVGGLIAAMTEVCRAKTPNSLSAAIECDDSWGWGAAVQRIAEKILSSIRRDFTSMDEAPTLKDICFEAELGEILNYAPYDEHVTGYVINPEIIAHALSQLEQLVREVHGINHFDARRLVVLAFDHLLSKRLMFLPASLKSIDLSGYRIYVPGRFAPQGHVGFETLEQKHGLLIGPDHVFVHETGAQTHGVKPAHRLSLMPDPRTPSRLRAIRFRSRHLPAPAIEQPAPNPDLQGIETAQVSTASADYK